MLNLLLKEESWLLVATTSAVLAVVALVIQTRRRHAPPMIIIASALSLFWGLWIAIMGTGHLFAVTTKTTLGTLPPNIHLWFAIPFGFAMAIPATGGTRPPPGYSLGGDCRPAQPADSRLRSVDFDILWHIITQDLPVLIDSLEQIVPPAEPSPP